MAVRIDTAAVINAIRLAEQGSTPSTPSSGYSVIYAKADGLYIVDDAGTVTGPLGDVAGPGSSTDNGIARFNGTGGKTLQDSGVTITDNNVLTLPDSATYAPMNITERSTAPSSPASGDIYLDDGSNTVSGLPNLRRYTGAAWEDLSGISSLTGEIFLSAAGMWPSTTSGCAANAKVEYGTNDVDLYTLDFDASTDEHAQVSVWMPDDWDAGTITAKFAWTAASSTGDVIWGLQGRAYANDDAIDQAWGTAQTATDTLLATGDIHYTAATSAITLAGTPAAGELVQFRVYRDADAGGDTLAADAKLLGVKVYYTKS